MLSINAATRLAFLVYLILVPGLLWSQVSGVMTAPNGKPVAGAVVFINHTQARAETDDFGQFVLNDIPPGLQELVAYKKGFTLYRAPMRVQAGRSYNLNLQFVATEKKPRGKSTPESEAAFGQALLGPEGLLIYNPETKVEVEWQDGKFRVLSGPVIAEYPNAGYRITAYFPSTTVADVSEAAYCYQEYQGSNVNQNMAVEQTRIDIYHGSLRHWLAATVKGKAADEGFQVVDARGNALPPAVAVPAASEGYYRIKSDEPLIIRYRSQPATRITLNGPVDFNASGIMINPRQVKAEGPMNKPGLAHQLPLDYRPIEDIQTTFAEALRYFYEKVYVQTDKPYYYPGEPLWFKAYINYYNRSWMDSLSEVLYVEIVSAKKEVLTERMFRIKDGMSHGDFILPDSIAEGTYYLRAYTTLRLNFGDSGLFTKPIRILNLVDKADPTRMRPATENSSVIITPQQKSYKVRDKITLKLQLANNESDLSSDVSVAVTDAAQVIAVPEGQTILNCFPIEKKEIPTINELKYRIERGVSFYAQFLNNKGVPEKTNLNFIQWKTGDVLYAETDEDGKFWQTGLQFTDSALYSYKSDKAKGKPYGRVEVLPRDVPPVQPPDLPQWDIVKAGTVQRIFSEYEVPKDSKLLEAVEVVGSRPENQALEESKRRPYGRADYVLSGKNLNVNSGNLLYALVGKVPGLVVSPTQNTVFFSRAMGTSLTSTGQPMVTINDVPMAGDAATVLQTIDFNTIESIEFTNRLNSLYGEQGQNGVIAVYTKTGAAVDKTDPNFQTIKLPGYSKVRKFQAPDYEKSSGDNQADYRSTIYWNPEVKIVEASGGAQVSFFASDLAGQYRVVVEGVTSGGRPVRGETLITIEEKP